jgi:hypothetical protein
MKLEIHGGNMKNKIFTIVLLALLVQMFCFCGVKDIPGPRQLSMIQYQEMISNLEIIEIGSAD